MGIIQTLEGLNRRKTWRKDKFILSAWIDTLIFSCTKASVLLVLGLLGSDTDLDYPSCDSHALTHSLSYTTTWFSSLQTADHGTSGAPKPHQPLINLLLYISLPISLWFYFFGEPWPIYTFLCQRFKQESNTDWICILEKSLWLSTMNKFEERH